MESNLTSGGPVPYSATPVELVLLSAMFVVISVAGMVGNSLVVVVTLTDRKMRQSVTNLFLANLAVADLIIMVVCVPEIVLFMMNRGYLLGHLTCSALRFTQNAALYVSVMTLVAVCAERYVAILQPLRAHILCTRRKISATICFIWPVALLAASPNLFYHRMTEVAKNFTLCLMDYPTIDHFLAAKLSESIAFYFVPLVLQVVMYIRIGLVLFRLSEDLTPAQSSQQPTAAAEGITTTGGTSKTALEPLNANNPCAGEELVVVFSSGAASGAARGAARGAASGAATDSAVVRRRKKQQCVQYVAAQRARRGVVKMLIAGVTVYFICFSPHQVLLYYSLASGREVHITWSLLIFVNTMAYLSSAANPLLYTIFSQKFRERFVATLTRCRTRQSPHNGRSIHLAAGHSSMSSVSRQTKQNASATTTNVDTCHSGKAC